MKIAITGASGQLGRLAIENLKTRVDAGDIVALVRDPSKVADLGIESREADYHKPETLTAALQGIDRLVLISSSDFDDRAGQHQNVINAATETGVKHLIYTSILKADGSPMIIAQDHKVTEAAIKASGIPYTFLRNGWYTENWTGSLPAAVEAGALIGSAGDAKVTPATRQDYAEAIAAVAAGEGHEGQIYELGGTAFTLSDLAAELSKQTGKDIPYNDLPEAAYKDILISFQLPEALATVIADADAQAQNGWLTDESGTLERLIGRPATPLAWAVAAALG
ncbi:NAD(P)H dehydrogenase (quinone) [Thalassococcus halodurans]|uniref:NAD(P)H dehydrogenase (Quinone) n=1 Tax=Thalassococcus halodurans TaxID=373675 RepID=A0A1H6BIB6_9RHOB|nr:SDR family oxidoreductase [Thalassococcus halodurans]SEG60107.1 NAD(P)H dehydrogenase (quinone) [Thalassococcus halodurans]